MLLPQSEILCGQANALAKLFCAPLILILLNLNQNLFTDYCLGAHWLARENFMYIMVGVMTNDIARMLRLSFCNQNLTFSFLN